MTVQTRSHARSQSSKLEAFRFCDLPAEIQWLIFDMLNLVPQELHLTKYSSSRPKPLLFRLLGVNRRMRQITLSYVRTRYKSITLVLPLKYAHDFPLPEYFTNVRLLNVKFDHDYWRDGPRKLLLCRPGPTASTEKYIQRFAEAWPKAVVTRIALDLERANRRRKCHWPKHARTMKSMTYHLSRFEMLEDVQFMADDVFESRFVEEMRRYMRDNFPARPYDQAYDDILPLRNTVVV